MPSVTLYVVAFTFVSGFESHSLRHILIPSDPKTSGKLRTSSVFTEDFVF
jgi:hypothetical protein